MFLAIAYTILGNSSQALAWLDRAVEERSQYLVFLRVDPIFDRLRTEPEFALLIEKIGPGT